MKRGAKFATAAMILFWIVSLVVFVVERDLVLLAAMLLISTLLGGLLAVVFGDTE